MITFENTVPVGSLARSPEDAYRQGLAVVDVAGYDPSASALVAEVGRFARYLDGTQTPEVPVSPRRLSVPEEEMPQMELYGRKFASLVMPLTRVEVTRLVRARFLVYTEIGASTGEHIDDPLDDDHMLSIGVTLIGRGVLRSLSYIQPGPVVSGHQLSSVRTPVRLEPGATVVQQGQSTVAHEAATYDSYRVVGVWDFAGQTSDDEPAGL
jgi:hypothetical protein